MSIDENMEQAGFAAWAATEGITNVVFSPVTAVGRTLGNVSGQRDHHLVLLDREWGIWQAARASRPREAGSGVDRARRIEDAAGLLLNRLWTHAILHCATHANKIGSPHIDGCRCDPAVSALRCAINAPPVAPEACPVADARWAVVDRTGRLVEQSASPRWAAAFRTKEEAESEARLFDTHATTGVPYRVVPLYAQPASATAEGGGDVRLFMRACQVLGCGARGVTENAGPWYCAIHHPEHPATPASAAGGEGAVEVGAHAMDVAERCYYAIKGGAPYRDSIRAMAAIIEAERPLPEAREGKS